MNRREQKVYKLSAEQWRWLERLAKAYPRAEHILIKGTERALVSRGLVAPGPNGPFGTPGHVLTDLGQRVYARLSVGHFCRHCRKPITFCRRVSAPSGGWECEACA